MATTLVARRIARRRHTRPARGSESAPGTARRAALTEPVRLKMVISGAVQGVGFRPFGYRLATELKLNGYVSNTAEGVFIEVEGNRDLLEEFQRRVQTKKPPRAIVQRITSLFLETVGYDAFEIHQSEEVGDKTAFILPDIATCADCLREIFDPSNRRFRYPFTNCTNCGPRFSIGEALPYDRPNTSMKNFAMVERCDRQIFHRRVRPIVR